MNSSGDAAEQVVRLSLEGTEVALKLTGSAAKNIAAALYTIYKNRDHTKTRGHQRLSAMLKSGKELKVFTLPEQHLKQFTVEARRYGVVYCALREKKPSADGLVDIMVRAEDASKINRIVERFKLATVDAASIKHEIEKSRAEKTAEPPVPEKGDEDRLLDDLMKAPVKEEKEIPNPTGARTEKFPLSEPISRTRSKAAEGTAEKAAERPSVREELREIREGQKQREAEKTAVREAEAKEKPSPRMLEHIQPPKRKAKAKGERS